MGSGNEASGHGMSLDKKGKTGKEARVQMAGRGRNRIPEMRNGGTQLPRLPFKTRVPSKRTSLLDETRLVIC